MRAAVIIAAAGKGQRMGFKKQYLLIEGMPMLIKAVQPFTGLPFVSQIIISVPHEDKGWVEQKLLPPFSLHPEPEIIGGGETRQETIELALERVDPQIDIVLVHDGARPFVLKELVEKVFYETVEKKAVIPVIKVKDTVKVVDYENRVVETPPREDLRLVQTPQGFKKELLMGAYQKAREFNWEVTDDAALLEKVGHQVFTLEGEGSNIKVTTRDDLSFLQGKEEYRTGLGIDIHPLEKGRRLVIGGIEIPYEKGCRGHSDGDVLTHALMDALLGSAGLPDIGHYFPDTEEKYKGAYSIDLLKEVKNILGDKGWHINNIDCTVLLEKPKISPYMEKMKGKIAKTLDIIPERVGIKATTGETLGFVGRGEGVLAQAVATIKREFIEGGNAGECKG